MQDSNTVICTGCGASAQQSSWNVSGIPATLNYRYTEKEAAESAKQGELRLSECRACGLVFNSAFDAELVSYDSAYDNRQGHSPAFLQHLNNVVEIVSAEIPSHGARILEIGCGKGDFLKQLCARFKATGMGYDTSYEVPLEPEPLNVSFSANYVSSADITENYDLVICRHVIEHVGQIGAFIAELSAIARAAGDAPLLFETPDFDWIVRESAFWDIFYEHCNYFTMDCLSGLCRGNGLKTILHEPVFDGQYQLLLAKPGSKSTSTSEAPPNRLSAFCAQAEVSKSEKLAMIRESAPTGKWALWGSGAKGVTLANYFAANPPLCLIDINPDKQQGFAPVSGIPILSPESALELAPEMILCANPNYVSEINRSLKALNYAGIINSL